MKVAVKNLDNKKVREIELPDEVFGYPYKEHLIHSAVLSYLAARRSGTHKTKTRRGGRGIGTKAVAPEGNRSGSNRRNPLSTLAWRRHGPWSSAEESRGQAESAREAQCAQVGAVAKIEGCRDSGCGSPWKWRAHKTRDLAGKLAGLGVSGRALLVDTHGNENLALAARNNPQDQDRRCSGRQRVRRRGLSSHRGVGRGLEPHRGGLVQMRVQDVIRRPLDHREVDVAEGRHQYRRFRSGSQGQQGRRQAGRGSAVQGQGCRGTASLRCTVRSVGRDDSKDDDPTGRRRMFVWRRVRKPSSSSRAYDISGQ